MGQFEDLQIIYKNQLGQPELQHRAIREITRMEEVLEDKEGRLTESEQEYLGAMLRLETRTRADVASLQKQMLQNAGDLDETLIEGFVRQNNNIRDNLTRLQSRLTVTAYERANQALQAAQMNSAAGGDGTKAGWESLLGTALDEPGFLIKASPENYIILEHLKDELGAFDPERYSQYTNDQYNRLVESAERQKTNHNNFKKRLSEEADDIMNAQKALVAGRKNEATNFIQQAAQRKPVELNGFQSDEIQQRVRKAMDEDPEVQKLRARTDYLWETVLDKGSSHRRAFANLLSKKGFQEWANENNFVVGNAEVVRNEEGKVIDVKSFVPGKDLMAAYEVFKKQRAKRPDPGMKGPLIARRGARDLVRLVKNDGEVILGKTLPAQASDQTGSYRISTSGGEVYVTKEDIKNVNVVKPKPEFGIGKAIRESRGALDKLRAEGAYRDLVRKGEMQDPVETELPEADDAVAEPPEAEPVTKAEPRKSKRDRRREALLTESEALDAMLDAPAASSDVPTATDARAVPVPRSERNLLGGIPAGGEGKVEPGSKEAGKLFRARRRARRKALREARR